MGLQHIEGHHDEGGLVQCRPKAEGPLLAEGFVARFVADRRMVKDSTATYEELGFEVTTLPLDEDGVAEDCSGCALVTGQFCVVYTRRRPKTPTGS